MYASRIRGLLCVLIVLLAVGIFAQQGAIIIETAEGGKNIEMYKELDGKWYESIAKSFASGCTPGIKSRFAEFSLNPPSHAEFRPVVPADGNYEIFVTWWNSGNCDKAKYTIHHADGETVQYLIQDGWGGLGSPNSNVWHSLGVYKLKAGADNYVIVSDEEATSAVDTINNSRMYCDAMKFEPTTKPVGGPATAAAPPTPSTTVGLPTPVAPQQTPVTSLSLPTPIPTASTHVSPFQPIATPVFAPPAATPAVVGGYTIDWYDNVILAQQMAQQRGKKIFVYFYTDNSDECTRLERESLSKPEVASLILRDFIPLKFNMRMRPSEAYQLGAFRAPTIILYQADGTPYRRIVGFKDPATLAMMISFVQ